jgi:Mg-chelatase subunit ChlD
MKLRVSLTVVVVTCFGLPCLGQQGAGVKPPARVVFVLDGTGSMMSRSDQQHKVAEDLIRALAPEQRFAIIDYRREATAASSAACVPATAPNKRKALCYLHDEQPAGGGGPGEAMAMAFKYEPDTIYFLSDGDMPEPEKVIRDMRSLNPQKRVRLHVIAFGMDYQNAAARQKTLEQFAREHGGEYRDVSEADHFLKRIGAGAAAPAGPPADNTVAPVASVNVMPAAKGAGARVVMLVDASGSMSDRFPAVREAASTLVGELDARQKFALIHFEDHKVDGTSPDCVAATAGSVSAAQEHLRKLYPFGQGDPLPALEAAFKAKPDVVYFFTDGDYGEFDRVFRLVRDTNAAKRTKLYAIVVGQAPEEENARLLKQLATQNGGEYVVVTPEPKVGRKGK